MNTPLVTIICICYNHARFVEQALDSVMAQTYSNLELIVIDDGSSDGSAKLIKRWIANHPNATLLINAKNLGYCKTFNKAFAISKGSFCIDLAADDILLPDRVEVGVKTLTDAGAEYGVTFSDAEHIDEHGKYLRLHSEKHPHSSIPSGDVYKDVIDRYFICSPSMMFRREVLDELNGYDESLMYEDFDLWIRSARKFKYIYTPKVLLRKRNVKTSLSQQQKKYLSDLSLSTLRVCEKIYTLNRTDAERDALSRRLIYEMRMSLRLLNFRIFFKYLRLWRINRSK